MDFFGQEAPTPGCVGNTAGKGIDLCAAVSYGCIIPGPTSNVPTESHDTASIVIKSIHDSELDRLAW